MITSNKKNKAFNEFPHFSKWQTDAQAILIGAGAGLSVDAGIDYNDEVSFAKKFPKLLSMGFRSKYMMMGAGNLPPEIHWGYLLFHIAEVRFGPVNMPVYKNLLQLTTGKEAFVFTTNVDGLFARHGFPADRIFTPQGDYAFYQCKTPCHNTIYPLAPLIEEYLPLIDPETGMLPKGRYPKCPICDGQVFPNVRGGNWFVEKPWMGKAQDFDQWLEQTSGKNLLVIDIGTGFNTPMWVRWPCEQIVRQMPKARLVRINPEEPEVPDDIADRSISFQAKAGEVLETLLAIHSE